MNGNEEQVVYDVVNHFVSKGMMFTAFDVTKAVKKLGCKVYHSEVKHIVKGLKLPDYKKTSKDISAIVFPEADTSIKALVYHPITSDPNNYNPVDLTEADDATTAVKVDSITTAVVDTKKAVVSPDNVHDVVLDRRGRFFVRAGIVSKAGWGAGDSIYLRSVDSIMEFSSDLKFADSTITVDRYKNFLIFEGYFMKAFGKVPEKIRMDVSKKKIVITEYK